MIEAALGGSGEARSFPLGRYHGKLRRVMDGRAGGPFWSLFMPQVDCGNSAEGPPWTFGGRRITLIHAVMPSLPPQVGEVVLPWSTLTASSQAHQHGHADERHACPARYRGL